MLPTANFSIESKSCPSLLCVGGYVQHRTPLGVVRTPCGFCRPTEVRNYDGATARRTEPISEAERIRRYAGRGSQVWYPHLQTMKEEGSDNHER